MGSSTRSGKPHQKSERSKTKHSGSSHQPPLSFLFVVNEFIVNYYSSNHIPIRDDWLNVIPPQTFEGYAHEIPSKVMRYCDGSVSEATGYQFVRQQSAPGAPKGMGQVWRYCNDETFIQAQQYNCFTVFACNPLLPIIVSEGDASTSSDVVRYHPLQFFHPREEHLLGVSQAVYEGSPMTPGGGPVKYVAGQNPSWMPSLVPDSYRNPCRHSGTPSKGLAGELPIVLGLMAFSEARVPNHDYISEIFLGRPGHRGRWSNRRWTHNHRPAGYPRTSDDDPRGFMVAVFEDPENEGSTADTIASFEWDRVIVKES